MKELDGCDEVIYKNLLIEEISNSELRNWLTSLNRRIKDNLLISEIEEGIGWRITLYTTNFKYSIIAKPEKYLGAFASTRMPRAGEDHMRGSDLADGSFSFETWHKILCDIVGYEKVPLEVGRTISEKNLNKQLQLKTIIQDILIDLEFAPVHIRGFADGSMGQNNQLSPEICQKLIDVGVLDGIEKDREGI